MWVFTDDVDYASTVVPDESRFIRSPAGSAEDLLVMAKGAGIVAANSTFSWWAGWFSKGRVLLPRPWTNSLGDRPGMYPPGVPTIPAEWQAV